MSGSGICWAICKYAPHPRQPREHPTTQFFTGRMPFLPPNQQRQSTEALISQIHPVNEISHLDSIAGASCRSPTSRLMD